MLPIPLLTLIRSITKSLSITAVKPVLIRIKLDLLPISRLKSTDLLSLSSKLRRVIIIMERTELIGYESRILGIVSLKRKIVSF